MDNKSNWQTEMKRRDNTGRVVFGSILVVGGIAYLLKDSFLFPDWLFTWPMILIAIGIISGFNHRFTNNGWWIMILIGSYFLINDIFPGAIERRYFWPVAIIIFGILLIIKPRRKCEHWSFEKTNPPQNSTAASVTNDEAFSSAADQQAPPSQEDLLDVSAVFGGVKKSVYSKNFKGGKISCIFGGGEINLLQADFNGTAILEMNAVFGGCTLIIPANWHLQINSNPFFGGIDDKRKQPTQLSFDKTLVLNGTVVFGGIEIKSY